MHSPRAAARHRKASRPSRKNQRRQQAEGAGGAKRMNTPEYILAVREQCINAYVCCCRTGTYDCSHRELCEYLGWFTCLLYMLCIFIIQKCMIVFVEKCMNTFVFFRAYILCMHQFYAHMP